MSSRVAPSPTTSTQRVINRAAALGLRPTISDIAGGSYAVVLNGSGRDAGFGVIYVGARTGRITRAYFTRGNRAPEERFDGYRRVGVMLDEYATYHRVVLQAAA